MDIQITPTPLSGTITPPPSKSQSHRLVIAAALSGEQSVLHHLAESQDITATRRCMKLLLDPAVDEPLLDCGESGSTLRFLLPIALVLRGGGRFTGRGRLMERPLGPYEALFQAQGVELTREGQVLTAAGNLSPGGYPLPGNVSSQFVTGLLFALPLLWEDSTIQLTSPLESEGYVEMTLEVLRAFRVQAEWSSDRRSLLIPGNQRYTPAQVTVESDWSQAAFWYAANFLNGALEIQGLNFASAQGDRAAASLAQSLAQPGTAEVDVSGCPDLLPPLAVMAAGRSGVTHFTHAARLRIKESDRLATVHALLSALGIPAEEGPDSLTVHGGPPLQGGVVDGANDHRIVMAAAAAACAAQGPVTILGAEAVRKSYPTFWEDYAKLGGVFHVL